MKSNLQKYISIGTGLSFLCFCLVSGVQAQDRLRTRTRKQTDLMQFARERNNSWNRDQKRAVTLFEDLKIPPSYQDQKGRLVVLQRLGYHDRPVFYATENVDAASIISSDLLWTKENEEPWLTGEGIEINLWDGGPVLVSHQEFQNSNEPRILLRDQGSLVSNHATHVAGTMAAAGIDEMAKGMAGMAAVHSWNFNNDIAEMAMAASEGIRLSNHSYGSVCGWDFNSSLDAWCWYGEPDFSNDEDYRFGYYDQESADMDYIAWSAPNYLMVKSAGNDRNEAPPDQPVNHYIWDDGWISMSVERAPDGGADGFDCLTPMAVSKNILTVGAVDDDKRISSFSAFGPTDDGRIKPDVLAGGTDVYSSTGASPDSYAIYNGTSMAAASVSGSVALLQELQEKLQPGVSLTSSSLKGLLIHTADEMGPDPGPDYQHGWGLLNMKEAAELIQTNAENGGQNILEGMIREGESLVVPVETIAPSADLKITLCWTDLPGTVLPPALNSPEIKLVNDLDLELIDQGSMQSHLPWKLDPSNPDAPATMGENHLDNVEQILLTDTPPGTFHIKIDHSGVLTGGYQSYSLLISGIATPSGILPPRDLQFHTGESSVTLKWNSPETVTPSRFLIYRNDLPYGQSGDTVFVDLEAKTDSTYTYYITSVYDLEGDVFESLGTNKITASPRMLRTVPFVEDFEDGFEDMQIMNHPDGWRWGDSELLSSYYLRYEENTGMFIAIDSYSAEKNAHITDIAATMPLKLGEFSDVEISFEYMFRTGIYGAIDVLYVMYKLPEEADWHEIELLTSESSWTSHTTLLPDEACRNGTQIGFYYDDLYLWGFGAGLDNITIMGSKTRKVDLSIVAMTSPVSGCTLSDNESVSITIRNEGEEDLMPGENIALVMNVEPGIQSEEILLLEQVFPGNSNLEFQWATAVDLSDPGTYDFEFLVSHDLDYNTNNNTFSTTVEVYGPIPVSILNEDLQFCENDPPVLINVDPPGGTLSGPGISELYFNPGLAGVGTHLISYTYSDQSGCQGSATAELIVNPSPEPAILDQDMEFCEDDEPVLILVSPEGGELSGPGITGLLFDPAEAGAGTHMLSYTYTDANTCTGSASADVLVNPLPEPTIITVVRRFCRNDSILLFEGEPSGGTIIGPGFTDLTFNPLLAAPGMNFCTYIYIDSAGCSGSDTFSLQVFENPWIDLGPDLVTGLDDTVELEPSGNGSSFLWYDGSTESSLSIITREIGEGEHIVWVQTTSTDNCSATDSINLSIEKGTGLMNGRDENTAYVYPNPFMEGIYLRLEANEKVDQLTLLSAGGQVYMRDIPLSLPYIALPDLPAGYYILKVQSAGRILTFGIIKL